MMLASQFKKALFAALIFLSGLSVALAAIPKNVGAASVWLQQEGGLRGGKAGTAFSLLELKRQSFPKSKSERIIIAQGNRASGKLMGSPGYFTVDLKKTRLTIDFSQTLNSKFLVSHLQKAFAKSQFVKKADMYFEPQGQSMSLILDLKQPVQLRAIPYAGRGKQTALVAFELKAASKATAKR